jgi:peroxiredoxin
MKKILIITILLLIFFYSSIYSQSFNDFTLKDINGNSITISSLLKESPVFITFWKSTCRPSMDNLKELKELEEKFKKKGVIFIAVNVGESKNTAVSTIKKLSIDCTILLDKNSMAVNLYQDEGIPIDMLINQKQKIIYYREGYYDDETSELEAALRTLPDK